MRSYEHRQNDDGPFTVLQEWRCELAKTTWPYFITPQRDFFYLPTILAARHAGTTDCRGVFRLLGGGERHSPTAPLAQSRTVIAGR